MSQFSFERVGNVSWPESGLQDQLLYASTLDFDGGPKLLNRIPPDLYRGPDGTLWLAAGGRLARLRGTNAADSFPLPVLDLEAPPALAPMPDKGLVFFGQEETRDVLARLGAAGQPLWQRADLPALQGPLTQAQLLTDPDGAIFLYTVRRGLGQVTKIDSEGGSASGVASFKSDPPKKIWLDRGSLYWVESSAGGHQWSRHNLATGQRHAAGKPPLQQWLDHAQGPLPGGGALLAVAQTGSLVWMGAGGDEVDRLALAGLVRTHDGLVAAIREHDRIHLTRWRDGLALETLEVSLPGSSPRLIAAEGDRFYFLDSDALRVIDSAGRRVDETPSDRDAWKTREGSVAIAVPVVEPSGAVLLAGADAEGPYVVRITRSE